MAEMWDSLKADQWDTHWVWWWADAMVDQLVPWRVGHWVSLRDDSMVEKKDL